MDSNRIDCLVETRGFGVEPRRECLVIKMGFTLIDLYALCFRACDTIITGFLQISFDKETRKGARLLSAASFGTISAIT